VTYYSTVFCAKTVKKLEEVGSQFLKENDCLFHFLSQTGMKEVLFKLKG